MRLILRLVAKNSYLDVGRSSLLQLVTLAKS